MSCLFSIRAVDLACYFRCKIDIGLYKQSAKYQERGHRHHLGKNHHPNTITNT